MLNGWKDAAPKDKSEIVKNLVGALAIVVGGGWVLFQWGTFFPKTQSEIISAASDIRADVAGRLNVSIGDGGATTLQADEVGSACEADPKSVRILDAMVSGNASLESRTSRPLKAYFEGITVSAADVYKLRRGSAIDDAPLITPIDFVQIGKADAKILLGGLSENRIEKGQSIKSPFVFSLKIPFKCADQEKLVSFAATFRLVPIDVITDADLTGKEVTKVLISSCQISSNGYGGCNLENIEAFGQ